MVSALQTLSNFFIAIGDGFLNIVSFFFSLIKFILGGVRYIFNGFGYLVHRLYDPSFMDLSQFQFVNENIINFLGFSGVLLLQFVAITIALIVFSFILRLLMGRTKFKKAK